MAGKAVAPQQILTYVGFDSSFDKSLQMNEKAFPRKHYHKGRRSLAYGLAIGGNYTLVVLGVRGDTWDSPPQIRLK
jgi:hypothetical protein